MPRLLIVLLPCLIAACGFGASVPSDARIIPLPPGMDLLSSDEGGCGNGREFECSRIFVIYVDDASALEASRQVAEHLEAKGWEVEEAQDDTFVARSERGHVTATVEPVAGDPVATDADLIEWGVPSDSIIDAREGGVLVLISECCGDPFPF